MLSTPAYALEALEDEQMLQVTGQTGIAVQIDDLRVEVVDDPTGDPDNFIEIVADNLSVVATDVTLGGANGDGWSVGSVSDPVFISVPKIERLDRVFDGNGDVVEGQSTYSSYPILSIATPSYDTTQNQPLYVEATANIYDPDQPESFEYDLDNNGSIDVTYYGLTHNLLRASVRGAILNGTQMGDGLDQYRITNANLWARDGDLNIIATANLYAEAVDITPGFDIDLGDASTFNAANPDYGDLTGYRKTDYSIAGYATPTNANYDDPTVNHNGVAIRGLRAYAALGRAFYQPLTLSVASNEGDIKLELAQIQGGLVCQLTDPETCVTESIDSAANVFAKDFYSDPLSRSHISFDNAYINGYELGGGLIDGLRVHYLNVTTCASATDVASCN